ncbi:long-chain-fatty-acid--CoA ligase 5-like [Babylonia areolata]|uniref:long-chain-fatty-acid--CoA ligase 5-like n=1 Tax=Babylonia areolata TaxID=304850 RepID=UPI003FD6276C
MADSAMSKVQEFLQENYGLVGAGAATLAGAMAVSAYLSSSSGERVKPPVDMNHQSVIVEHKERIRSSGLLDDPHQLMTYLYDDAKTTYEAFQRGLRVSNNGPCLGRRTGADRRYTWLTYKQVLDKAQCFGSGLMAKGLAADNSTFVGIYSGNSVEWAVADLGSQMFSMVPVPLYDTLGIEACKYIVNQTKLCTIVCDDPAKAKRLLQDAAQLPSLKRFVLTKPDMPDDLKQVGQEKNVEVLLFKDLEALGENKKREPKPPKPDDLATLCYTSGTTGDPKGVMLTHANLLITLSSVYLQAKSVLNLLPSDVHLSYLPLAHMFERCVHLIVFMQGAQIGYFSGDIRKLTEDLMELRPSLFPTVPRLLNRIYDKVNAGVNGSWFKSTLLKVALAQKMKDVKSGVLRKDSVWDRLVFSKIQRMLGGRVRLIITGSAPLSPTVLDFVRCAFGCLVMEGYGQTESGVGVTFNIPGETESGNVGPPLPCNFVKLVDVPEMDYFAKADKGEVCCKGGNVMKGYYQNPEKTAEALDKDGWLHSGDIGMWLPNGTLKIIDRKKNIFKLAQGEYVAVEKVESIYHKCRYVGQCFVDADSLKPCLMAVVVPDEEVMKDLAQSMGLPTDLAGFCQSEKAREIILKDMLEIGKNNQLKGFEQTKDIHLQPEPFSVENGLLTPTMKNKRPALRKRFKATIDDLYRKHQL